MDNHLSGWGCYKFSMLGSGDEKRPIGRQWVLRDFNLEWTDAMHSMLGADEECSAKLSEDE